jgi:hypothetical protein
MSPIRELHWEASVNNIGVCVVTWSANPKLNVLQEVADAKRYWTVEERMEHVRIAAAGPDLLAALKEALGVIYVFHGNAGWEHYQHSPEMKRFKAAIDKAEKRA